MPSVESLIPTEVTGIDQYPDLYELWDRTSPELITDPASVRDGINWDRVANPLAVGVAGVQRGDEGKGDEENTLVQTAVDRKIKGIAVKAGGGGGSGHTFHPKDGPEDGIVFSVLPAAVDQSWKQVVGRGVLGRPDKLIREITLMKSLGYDVSPRRIMVDGAAFLSWQGFVELDKAEEIRRKGKAIGTTKSGVGPSASTYVARQGMNYADLLLPSDQLREKVTDEVDRVNRQLRALDSSEQFDVDEVFRQFREYSEFLGPYIQTTFPVVRKAMLSGEAVAIELSQAYGLGRETGIPRSLASVDTTFGPFVRRYHLNERRIGTKIGVFKLVETAVGSHILYAPIPLELQQIIYERTAARGRPEAGAVSGRKRDIQWLQVPMVRGAVETMGLTALVLKKVDVLDQLPYLEFGTHYIFPDGEETDVYDPEDPRMLDPRTTMRTIRVQAWNRPTAGITRFEDCPREFQAAVAVLEKLFGIPIIAIGNGPHVDEKIRRPGYPYLS